MCQGSGHPPSDAGWLSGKIFFIENNRLNATTKGSPIGGRVARDGEYRYIDSSGVVRVLQSWRLEMAMHLGNSNHDALVSAQEAADQM